MLDGRISVSVKLARWRKARKCTGFTTVRNGTQRGEIFQKASESGSKKREPQRSGSGKEALSRILSLKANGTEGTSE